MRLHGGGNAEEKRGLRRNRTCEEVGKGEEQDKRGGSEQNAGAD